MTSENGVDKATGASKRRRVGVHTLFGSKYIPHLDNGPVIRQSMQALGSSILSSETSVRVISLQTTGASVDNILDAEGLSSYLKGRRQETNTTDTFFFNRHLVSHGQLIPTDANRLRVSPSRFELFCSEFHLSPSFVTSLANIHQPSAREFPCQAKISNKRLDFWLTIPVRVQVECSDNRHGQSSSIKGKSQMNPLNYLHLSQPKPKVDIRGSKVAIYFHFDPDTGRSTSLVFNFQDGRWRKIVEEPIHRMKEVLTGCNKPEMGRDPIYIQSVVLTSAIRWWNNALNSFNDQLIGYEEILINQDLSSEELSQFNTDTNRSLHCMAAHLHRYGSELTQLSEIVQDFKWYNNDFHDEFVRLGLREKDALEGFLRGLDHVNTQVCSTSKFRDELEQKINNVLAVLVDNNQASNDLLLLKNSTAMQDILNASQMEAEQSGQVAAQTKQLTEEMKKILQATQKDAEQSGQIAAQTRQLTEEMTKILQATQEETAMSRRVALQSQRLSEEMMKDSVAMKTIALLTTIFLPGTSFAAILAMPFFTDTAYLSHASRLWIWVALTVPSTAICFFFYFEWSKKESKRKRESIQKDEELVNTAMTPTLAPPLTPL
ncbi:uncharacterized protein Z518_00492 [Rhinocladiella mackenziei CBS 650.93]|uniref:Rhinocladiella mackenziei CBS 650.93 unplaced genomic scaffold supercont1.1, whole genome shotgun sequence n=1 Tax=Rhinocladiella mackenziei CBS 650.93 TaxID=1442369 RepID=A0A0D2G433_9EURO|nr:uncharacterized protein Z518_00492 [Rhinocladiella mackenziei CBS 650.93]KIX09412.1 hypothetical protein Z518_00492 [Rhinocladiella mackenziei CBS 650.93]